jgi:predicted dehydrogenase
MRGQPLRVALAGCGNIANQYAPQLMAAEQVELVGVTDLEEERAHDLGARVGCDVYPSLDRVLAADRVDAVVNLTTHHAHVAVTTRCLQAAKHVYTEKPLALTYPEAQELVALARERGLRLGSAPATFLGEAQQTAWKLVREGRLGAVRVAYAEVNWGRIEAWHPAPEPFYDVGVMVDVGVYPLAILTAMFGPARRVWAYGRVLYPDRVTRQGRPFRLEAPDFVVAAVELESGTLARLTASFYVGQHSKQSGIELHGDQASLFLASWLKFDSPLELAEVGGAYQPVPLVRQPPASLVWTRGVTDLAEALAEGRPHRPSGEHAAHIVEILSAAQESMRTGRPVAVRSSFPPPEPMEWALP